ncbi:MBL fold metallo-hydrolase [Amaricoccus solimangrovi]|uniref:MBL fold metallo-hydrolase n=1 Tax=Amaricoccus solimangrovi TaxID=2589815 RepID=A0A501WIS1_9RHOB|nr:MBL fold metallo-hydrolase [Amaricoccus solimangrovi]TPE49248.1 MBL fold metallo-hydrolase [Amaricoccus solimangrovi]
MARETQASETRPRVRVRMYRQGLGDCFLVSVLRDDAPPFHMMIDCGVILGTPDATGRLRAVLGSVIEETGGRIDVLAVTHEHYDHVAGFFLARDLFAAPEEAGAAGKLSVGEVWFAWTEDPASDLARTLREERAAGLRALTAMALRLGAAGLGDEPAVGAALSFFGVEAKESGASGLGHTAEAMAFAAGLAPPGRVRYLEPGAVLAPEAAPELRFRVLGPPMDRASLRRTDSTREVYHIAAGALEASVLLAAGEDGAAPGEAFSPFGPGWGLPLASLGELADDRAKFFRELYLDDAEQSWRRIDGAWLASAEGLALALDGATNNTSLVLAIELVEGDGDGEGGGGEVLLFPADAQVGNWLSWDTLAWPGPEGTLTAADLLARTVFYKVGHHGSHNATLRARGLERMPAPDLVSFIPVDEEMARKKRWNAMPLPALLEALRAHCGPGLVRLDEDPPADAPGVTTGGTGVQYGSLYVDWTRALPARRAATS